MCPFAEKTVHRVIKKGFFDKKCGKRKRIQRFFCHDCRKCFSSQTGTLTYREHKPHINNMVFRTLGAGVSQRKVAAILGVHQKTVERKLIRAANLIAKQQMQKNLHVNKIEAVVFDEMETHEHSKLKPVSICIAVEEKSRKLLSVRAAQMPAKGLLARASRKKYGVRKDLRPIAMEKMMTDLKLVTTDTPSLKSDKNPRYPRHVKRHYPNSKYKTFKGRRACVVGQGELKRGGWDPLFALNHTCAMIRDNLKCLARRTWCTTKLVTRLQMRLWLYLSIHNQIIDGIKRPILGSN